MALQNHRSSSGRAALAWMIREFRACASIRRTQVELSGMKERDLADIGLHTEPLPYG